MLHERGLLHLEEEVIRVLHIVGCTNFYKLIFCCALFTLFACSRVLLLLLDFGSGD